MKWIWWVVIIVSLTLFSGCKKEVRLWDVQYKAVSLGPDIPEFRLTYKTASGGTKLVGILTTGYWESDTLFDVESGSPVELEMEIISGKGAYELQILRDGALHESGSLVKGETTLVNESYI